MTPERYARLKELFARARELPEKERSTFLDHECGDDSHLRAEVESLLEANQSDFLRLLEDDSPPPPDWIGAYKILKVLGTGGMGVVYLAEQEHPCRQVALKVVKPGFVPHARLKRFEYEAHVLGQLQHPGIAQIFEAGTADSGSGPQPFFAMEYVQGQQLMDHVTANQLGTRERLRIMLDICEAVHHAHQKGVIHRDLKPGNILVDGSGQPKILDFGVARATDADVRATTDQTDIGQLVGTIQYMSPEQASGNPDALDTCSDVYALGVICYELLANRLPYDVRERMIHEAVRVIQEEEPARLSSIDRAFRGDLETIVAKALEKDKTRRYQSASELATDVNCYLGDEPLSIARPASNLYQLQKFARRNKALVGGTICVLIAIIAGFVTTAWQWRVARAAEQRATHRFSLVRELANTFVFDVPDKIFELPGSRPAMDLVVTTGLTYLNELASDVNDDFELRQALVRGYVNIGDIQGHPDFPNLGGTEASLRSYHNALALLEPDRHLVSTDPLLAQRLSIVTERIADIELATGKTAEALSHYRESLKITEDLAKSDPGNPQIQRGLQIGYQRMGNVLLELGKLQEALTEYGRSMTLCESALHAKPDDAEARSDWALGHFKIANTHQRMGRIDQALSGFRQMYSVAKALQEENPDSASAALTLANASDRIGNILLEQKDLEEARAKYYESLAIREDIARTDPQDTRAQGLLAISYKKIGNVEWAMIAADEANADAHRQAALDWYQRSLPIAEALVKTAPTRLDFAHGLACSLEEIGQTLMAIPGRSKEALPYLDKARVLRKDVFERNRDNPQIQVDLAVAYYTTGEFYRLSATYDAQDQSESVTSWREAKSWYERARDLLVDLQDRGVLPPSAESHITAFTNELAACEAELARLQEAP